MGLILFNQGKLEEAKAEYKEAIFLNPKNAIAHNKLGLILFNQGKLEEAKAEYQQAILFDPNYTNAHDNLKIALKAEARRKQQEQKQTYVNDPQYFTESSELVKLNEMLNKF